MKEQATVETRSPRMQCLEEKRDLCRDLLGGTTAMRKAGKKWLPQYPGEDAQTYKLRLDGAILTNFLDQTIKACAGKVFSKPPALGDDVPPALAVLCADVDRQGRALGPFLFEVLSSALADGVSYILADLPRTDGVLTLADEQALGVRPYAVHIPAERLLEVVAEMRGGSLTPVRVRIEEETERPVPGTWEYEEVEQVRVLILDNGRVRYELWQERETDGPVKKEEWVKVEEGWTSMTRIPLIGVYTNRVGYLEGEPPFQAVAELNLKHWRSTADQTIGISHHRYPIICAVGVPETTALKVGPAQLFLSPNPDAKFSYLDRNGSAMADGREDLKSIEDAISTATAILRVERAGTVTATAAALESEEANAALKAIAGGLKDSAEELLICFAELLGLPPEQAGSVAINTDFGAPKGTTQGLTSLQMLNASGQLSTASYLRELAYRGELSPEFDQEQNQAELTTESAFTPPQPQPGA